MRAACPSCSCSTRPTWQAARPSGSSTTTPARSPSAPRRGRASSCSCARWPTGCARSRRSSSWPSPTTAATSWPRSTARARSCRPPTRPSTCGCGPGCPTPRPGAWPSSSWPTVTGPVRARRAARRPVPSARRAHRLPGLRAAAVPLRPTRPPGADGRRPRRRGRRSVHRHADRSGAARRRRGPVDVRTRARLPALHRHPGAARRGGPLDGDGASTSTCPATAIGATIGSKEFVGTLPQWLRLRSPGPRHRAVPGGVVPDLRDGRDPRVVPTRRGADDAGRGRRPGGRRPRRRRAGAGAVGEQPVQPDRRPRRPRCRGGVGSGPRRAGLLRRVLRRVHVGRSWPQHPRARSRRRRRRPLAVQALEPRRGARRLLRR